MDLEAETTHNTYRPTKNVQILSKLKPASWMYISKSYSDTNYKFFLLQKKIILIYIRRNVKRIKKNSVYKQHGPSLIWSWLLLNVFCWWLYCNTCKMAVPLIRRNTEKQRPKNRRAWKIVPCENCKNQRIFYEIIKPFKWEERTFIKRLTCKAHINGQMSPPVNQHYHFKHRKLAWL